MNDRINSAAQEHLLSRLVDASAGSKTRFALNFIGHLCAGTLYAFELLPFHWVGFLLGVILPGIWVFCAYRLLKLASIPNIQSVMPGWMKKEPGNSLLIFLDVVFLLLIWFFIAWGPMDKTWIKVLWAIIIPLAILSILRSMVINNASPGHEEQ